MTARALVERVLCTDATVRMGRDIFLFLVTLEKKRNLPALLEWPEAQDLVRIPAMKHSVGRSQFS